MSFILVPVVQPSGQVVVGTGGGITSYSDMTYAAGNTDGMPAISTLSVPAITAQQMEAPAGQDLLLTTVDANPGISRTVQIEAGVGSLGSGGVAINGGQVAGLTGGVIFANGAVPGVHGGDVQIRGFGLSLGAGLGAALDVGGATATVGGGVLLAAGATNGAAAGELSIEGAGVDGSSNVSLTGGNSPEGASGGGLSMEPAVINTGGDVYLRGGDNSAFTAVGAAVVSGGGSAGGNGGRLTLAPGLGSTANGDLEIVNASAANNAQVVTVGNVGPGAAGVSIQEWLRVVVDGNERFIPLFSA